jgi:RNA polymerase sigma-70 factor (ECF subfamily)
MSDPAQRLYEQFLVVRFQAGDDHAFTEIVERYNDRLSYYLRRLLGGANPVDDVLQETWLAAFRGLSGLRSPRALSVWLYRIARNAALAERRGAGTWPVLTDEPAAPQPTEQDPEFVPADATRIHAALGRLRPEHREVLVLRFLAELSYEDIGDVVGCPVGTVRSRLHYAKRELRREMGD